MRAYISIRAAGVNANPFDFFKNEHSDREAPRSFHRLLIFDKLKRMRTSGEEKNFKLLYYRFECLKFTIREEIPIWLQNPGRQML